MLILLLGSVISLVITYYQKVRWRDAFYGRDEDCGELLGRALQSEKLATEAKIALDFQQQFLQALAQREMVCVLNDGQMAQLVNTVSHIVGSKPEMVN